LQGGHAARRILPSPLHSPRLHAPPIPAAPCLRYLSPQHLSPSLLHSADIMAGGEGGVGKGQGSNEMSPPGRQAPRWDKIMIVEIDHAVYPPSRTRQGTSPCLELGRQGRI
jgi:hypothetical protein